jgi:hypothetical protein
MARAGSARAWRFPPPPAGAGPGTPVAVGFLGRLPHPVIRLLFRHYGVARVLPTEHGVALHRLVYTTRAPDGRPVAASGLVALPHRGGAPRGIVSWQHGTASLRTAAPSARDAVNGLLPAAVFAGHGYALLAPDYLGLGISEEPHEYYLAEHMAAVVRDFVVAAWAALRHHDVALRARLHLAGFSEGGHASLAAQRAIERDPVTGLPLVAVAPVAAPVDLPGLGMAGALAGGSRYCSLYLAWIAKSYAAVYGERLTDVLRPEWARVVPEMFDGRHDGDSTVAALPADPRALLTEDFLDAYDSGAPHWFLALMAENSLLDWCPVAPVRSYFGTRDADVTPEQAAMAEARLGAGGAEVRAVCVGDVDHEGALERAAPLVRQWFDELGGDLTSS